MKPILAIVVAACALLASCSVPFGRSTAAAGGSAPLATCNRGGDATPNGGMACLGDRQYRCTNGAWQPSALRCEP